MQFVAQRHLAGEAGGAARTKKVTQTQSILKIKNYGLIHVQKKQFVDYIKNIKSKCFTPDMLCMARPEWEGQVGGWTYCTFQTAN